MMASFRKGCN